MPSIPGDGGSILESMTRRRSLLPLALLFALTLLIPTEVLAGPAYTLTVSLRGRGGGSVTSGPAGIDCGATCAFAFNAATVVTLTATPDADSAFMGWGGACTGAGACQVTMDAAYTVRARFAPSYRPDAWIKLCGLSTGCTVGPPPPHPWRGNDRYNTTGFKQTISVRMEDGEGVRFWIRLENDGALGDTIVVQGCKGTPRFVIDAVLVGRHKRPDWRAKNITKAFKNGTASFTFPPASAGKVVYLTLNIVAPTTVEGITYRCPVTIRSAADPTLKDTVAGRTTTY